MKLVFFGSSDFAVSPLERLLGSDHEVLTCVTRPDREKGRHLKVQATPVKNLASSKGVGVYQPEDVNESSSLEYLRSLNADLFVVVGFGQVLARDVLAIPKRYSVNLHPSLLPRYRGAAPINWSIINGERVTGLTIIRMNERMDAGDIILKRKLEIAKEDNSQTLTRRLSSLGAILLLDAIRFIEEDRVRFKKQDDKKATPAPRLKKEDGIIDWSRTAEEIHNKVRGTIPWPGAYTYFNNKKINFWKTHVLDGEANPAEIVEAQNELIIGTKKGLLKVEEIQLEGKKRMNASDFVRGHREFKKGASFLNFQNDMKRFHT